MLSVFVQVQKASTIQKPIANKAVVSGTIPDVANITQITNRIPGSGDLFRPNPICFLITMFSYQDICWDLYVELYGLQDW